LARYFRDAFGGGLHGFRSAFLPAGGTDFAVLFGELQGHRTVRSISSTFAAQRQVVDDLVLHDGRSCRSGMTRGRLQTVLVLDARRRGRFHG